MDMNEVSKFEQRVGRLKLSEAIRIGAKMRPKQCRGQFFKDGASCALGAAYEAVHGRQPDTVSPDKASGMLMDVYLYFEDATGVFILNDTGHTREQIADLLEARGL